jgi:hypothetical protein
LGGLLPALDSLQKKKNTVATLFKELISSLLSLIELLGAGELPAALCEREERGERKVTWATFRC